MRSFNRKLNEFVIKTDSRLCVGLDINPEAFKKGSLKNLKEHTFNVIDATRDFAVAYKPNFAFFERWGSAGFAWLEETVSYIGNDHIKIADAKRGDIGNTAKQYAESIFNHFNFDCVTVNPYLGKDSIDPFLNYEEKGVFILCRTSNPSAKDFQDKLIGDKPLFAKVVEFANKLNKFDNVGLVVGATATEELKMIRNLSPEIPLLIPGIGSQGGDLVGSIKVSNKTGVGIVNISRGISFVGNMKREEIYKTAKNYHKQITNIMKNER
jgi:orotidine-5'-phosphate decarboxylase